MLTWEREGEREKERAIRCHRCCSPIIDVDVGDGWGEGEGDALSSYCCWCCVQAVWLPCVMVRWGGGVCHVVALLSLSACWLSCSAVSSWSGCCHYGIMASSPLPCWPFKSWWEDWWWSVVDKCWAVVAHCGDPCLPGLVDAHPTPSYHHSTSLSHSQIILINPLFNLCICLSRSFNLLVRLPRKLCPVLVLCPHHLGFASESFSTLLN